MAKRGRGRRTAEERVKAKDRRSTVAYVQRISEEVEFQKLADMVLGESTTSKTQPRK